MSKEGNPLEDKRKYDKDLIEILNKFRDNARKVSLAENFVKNDNYYRGKVDQYFDNQITNAANIIKSIVDTKTTLVLDNHITTSIVPSTCHFRDIETIEETEAIADILEDAKNNIFKLNSIDSIKESVVRDGCICKGVVKVYWDEDLSDGLGDVRIETIHAQNIYADPKAKNIQEANYVFIKVPMSLISLRKKYPEYIKEIDLIAERATQKSSKGSPTSNWVAAKTDQVIEQYYAGSKNIRSMDTAIDVYECYLKDDSVFMPSSEDMDIETKSKEIEKQEAMFPDGRCIIYCGDDLILEDKNMANPFLEYTENYIYEVNQDGGSVKDLIFIQDRINNSFEKIKKLVRSYLSMIVLDEEAGLIPSDLINQDAILLNAGSLNRGLAPIILGNNTLEQIEFLIKYIEFMQATALKISRVNEMMLSGDKPSGVTSGDQVEALNESAMTSIRQMQRNFSYFMMKLTDKIIYLVQKGYSIGRLIKLSSGQEYAVLPIRGNEDGIRIIDKYGKELKRINADLNIGKYEVEVLSGTELPRTRSSLAQLTMMLVDKGMFGDPTMVDNIERILKALDYPNWRAIVDKMKKELAEKANSPESPPPVSSLIEKLGISFKDLAAFPEAQAQILNELGLKISAIPPSPSDLPI